MDEHFIVWMRTSGLPNFKKLWGKIPINMEAGDFYVKIWDNYDVEAFQGQKTFFITNMNAFGGKNQFQATLFLVVGSLCLFFSLVSAILLLRERQKQSAA